MSVKQRSSTSMLVFLTFALALRSACGLNALHMKYTFTFIPDPSEELSFIPDSATPVILGGRSPKECGVEIPEFSQEQQVGGFAVAVTDNGQGCYTNERYVHGDYPIRTGSVGGFRAYELGPYNSSATQFAASGQQVYVSLKENRAYKVYALKSGALLELDNIAASEVRGNFTRTAIKADKVDEATVYVFLPATQDVPPPKRLVLSGAATECNGVSLAETLAGEVAVVTMKDERGKCLTDGRYNFADFLVEKGVLTGTDGSSRTSYRVHPPQKPPSQGWAASAASLFFSSRESGKMTAWTYSGVRGGFAATDTFTPENGNFMQTSIQVHKLTEPLVVFLESSSARVSVWPLVSESTEAAWLAGNVPEMSLTARRFHVGGRPFVPEEDWPYGPGTHTGNYGSLKRYHPVARRDGREGIIWQDVQSGDVWMTWLAADLLSAETMKLLGAASESLVAATSDGDSEIVAVMVGDKPQDKFAVTSGIIVKFRSMDGSEILRSVLPASDLNIHSCCNPASMSWDVTHSNTIGIMLGRTMTKGGDGLNHQGGIFFVLNASSLDMMFNYGQTSGHSFGASLIPSASGSYLGMDLGDNFPRGIHLWRFNGSEQSRQSRVVYTFKTKHSTSPSVAGKTFPVYDDISSQALTYYKWSNDNYVYTELGHPGLVETGDDGILVFFAGEQPPLVNSKVGSMLNSPRNIGFVKVPKDLQSNDVLSPGSEEIGGFYNFGGGWSNQRNVGVSFLTSQIDVDQSVSRLKTTVLSSGQVLLLFEVWAAKTYNRTEYLIVDKDGAIQVPQTPIGYDFQLPFAEDPILIGDHVVMYTGTAQGKLVRYELCVGVTCPGPATTTTSTTTTSTAPAGPTVDPAGKSTETSETSDSQHTSMSIFKTLPFLSALCFAFTAPVKPF